MLTKRFSEIQTMRNEGTKHLAITCSMVVFLVPTYSFRNKFDQICTDPERSANHSQSLQFTVLLKGKDVTSTLLTRLTYVCSYSQTK